MRAARARLVSGPMLGVGATQDAWQDGAHKPSARISTVATQSLPEAAQSGPSTRTARAAACSMRACISWICTVHVNGRDAHITTPHLFLEQLGISQLALLQRTRKGPLKLNKLSFPRGALVQETMRVRRSVHNLQAGLTVLDERKHGMCALQRTDALRMLAHAWCIAESVLAVEVAGVEGRLDECTLRARVHRDVAPVTYGECALDIDLDIAQRRIAIDTRDRDHIQLYRSSAWWRRGERHTPLRPRHSMMACASSMPASVSIMTSLALRAHDWPGAAGNTRCTWWRQAKKCYGGRACLFLFPPMDAVKALFLRSPDRSAKVQAHHHPSPRAACTPHGRLPRSAG